MANNRKLASEQKSRRTIEKQKEMEMAEAILKGGTSEQLDKVPKWVSDPRAKKEWKRLVREFRKLDILSNLDFNNLGLYCNSFVAYLDATEELKITGTTAIRVNKMGDETPIKHPLVEIQRMYSDEVKKYSNFIGLSMDSRLKMGALKVEQMKGEVDNEFSGI